MKKILAILLSLSALFVGSTGIVDAYVSVRGYYKSNGTYVAPHVRSNPNGLKSDNYGYTPNQGIYNKTYGTRGESWDTPTYISDPYYSVGKSMYDSNQAATYPVVNNCPANSYFDGVSACKCLSGYVVNAGQCVTERAYYFAWCNSRMGIMSKYNESTKQCACLDGYEFNGSLCLLKAPKVENRSNSTSYRSCPLNSHETTYDSSKCECNSGFEVNSMRNACVQIMRNQNNESKLSNKQIGINYYLERKTCIGLTDDQFSECLAYAINH